MMNHLLAVNKLYTFNIGKLECAEISVSKESNSLTELQKPRLITSPPSKIVTSKLHVTTRGSLEQGK